MSDDFDTKSFLRDKQRAELERRARQHHIKRVKTRRRGPDSTAVAIVSLSTILVVMIVVFLVVLLSSLGGGTSIAAPPPSATLSPIPITATPQQPAAEATAVLPDFYILELSATAPPTQQGQANPLLEATPTSAFVALPTQFSLANSTMVFVCYIAGHDDICTMNADGSNFQRITSTAGTDWYPSMSREGDLVVYSSQRGGNFDIWLMDVNGSRHTQVTRGLGSNFAPDLSPDGTRVVFASTAGGDGLTQNIWSINVDGTNPTQLTDTPADDIDPTWSPDGSQVLFSSNRAGLTELFVMNADGSNVRQLTDGVHNGGRNDWSPDGRWITFYAGPAGDKNIYIMDAACAWTQVGCITEPDLLVAEGNSKGPSFSPDSQWIVFAGSDFQGDLDNEIYIVSVDGTTLYKLTTNGYSDWQPRWAP